MNQSTISPSCQLLSAKDLQEMGFARAMVYNLFNRADFPTIKIGKRKFVRASKFAEWCEKMEQSGEALEGI